MPVQHIAGTVNLVTQWKSATISRTGSRVTSRQHRHTSWPAAVAPKIRKFQVSGWKEGTGP